MLHDSSSAAIMPYSTKTIRPHHEHTVSRASNLTASHEETKNSMTLRWTKTKKDRIRKTS